jgi:uncharacterized protein YgiM (DUF1202 family)
MKKLIVALCLGLLVCGLAAAQVARGGTLYAAAKKVTLKSSTGFFASTRGTLNYGDRVTVLQVNGKWVEVRSALNASLSGWTASTNLSAKQVVSGTGSTASTQEVALAGKGFNQEVENAYRSNGNLNYADVDRTETQVVNDSDLLRFLEEGRLAKGDQ